MSIVRRFSLDYYRGKWVLQEGYPGLQYNNFVVHRTFATEEDGLAFAKSHGITLWVSPRKKKAREKAASLINSGGDT